MALSCRPVPWRDIIPSMDRTHITDSTAENTERNQRMIYAMRSIHMLIALVMFAATAVVYYSAVSQTYGILLLLASIALLIEGIAVVLNNWDCPVSYIQKRYGDDKPFFELCLPGHIAKRMFRVNIIMVLIGYLLLLINFAI